MPLVAMCTICQTRPPPDRHLFDLNMFAWTPIRVLSVFSHATGKAATCATVNAAVPVVRHDAIRRRRRSTVPSRAVWLITDGRFRTIAARTSSRAQWKVRRGCITLAIVVSLVAYRGPDRSLPRQRSRVNRTRLKWNPPVSGATSVYPRRVRRGRKAERYRPPPRREALEVRQIHHRYRLYSHSVSPTFKRTRRIQQKFYVLRHRSIDFINSARFSGVRRHR